MRIDTAPCRLLLWLAAAAVGWALIAAVVLLAPQALGGFAVAGVLLWRKGQRPVDVPPTPARSRGDVRRRLAPSLS